MEQIKKMDKTVDMDALFRWILRKWRRGLLIFFVALMISGSLAVIMEIKKESLVMTEEEKEALDEYLKYDSYIDKLADMIDLLEKDIEENLEEAAGEEVIDGEIIELSDRIKWLEMYNSYYNRIEAKKGGLRDNFNEAQNAYIDGIEKSQNGESNEKDQRILYVKRMLKTGIKNGTLIGIFAVGVWSFALVLIFGLNKRIKSKEDIWEICGDMPVVEGKRCFIKSRNVQIGENLGIGKVLLKEDLDIINLAGEIEFDVDSWNDKLAQNMEKEVKKEMRVILIIEIGVSLYSDVIRVKEEYENKLIGGVCVR